MLKKIAGTLALAAMAAGLLACQDRTLEAAAPPSQPAGGSLVVASEGRLIRFDLDTVSVRWSHSSKADAEGNRNTFAHDGRTIYLPFESGKLVAFDAATGEVRWTHLANTAHGAADAVADGEGEVTIDPANRPYYLSRPLIDGDLLYIASAGQPHRFEPWFTVVDRRDGSLVASEGIETNFNLFAPVLCRGHVFVNSAVYLSKYTRQGVATSYGLHDESAFEAPLYAQMQCDGKALYLGDERGRFYALPLDADANVAGGGDIMDPQNSFTGRPGMFRWTYRSEAYPRLAGSDNGSTALAGGTLIVGVRQEDETRGALVGLDAAGGKERWVYAPGQPIRQWTADQAGVIGDTGAFVFVFDLQGREQARYPVDPALRPLSNVVAIGGGDLAFATEQGIAVIDRASRTTRLKIAHPFARNAHDTSHVAYFAK
ncbi:PQQ-binding-like beta-propeller repeat protein [Xenophilus azovorans]|uniref:outer membrane protein assembly factor BamB family protein n=1 Tax=Xenophilus azovorans TaxID=151755 RepID=UPI0005715CA4|nr:PQQ-binding-like beta-propeller repeat protein [Xenophilus azovorans]